MHKERELKIHSLAWGHFGRSLGLPLLNKQNMKEKNTEMGNGVFFMNEPFLALYT